MARITNPAAAALGGKNEAAKNSSDFSFRKPQGPSQRLDFLFHYSLIEAELWEFFLKKSERQKRAGAGRKTEFLSHLAHARGHFRVSRVSLDGLRKKRDCS